MSNSERALRQELLFRALEKYPDPEAALVLAAKLERFILAGIPAAQSQEIERHTQAARTTEPPPESATAIALRSAEDPPSDDQPSQIERRRWSADEDEQLRNLLTSGIGVDKAAERLNRTLSSVYARVRQLGLARARPGRPPRYENAERRRKSPETERTEDTNVKQVEGKAETEAPVGIETVIRFLRSRDYSIVQMQNGHYRLDEREELTAQALFDRANRVRERLGRPRWSGPLALNQ